MGKSGNYQAQMATSAGLRRGHVALSSLHKHNRGTRLPLYNGRKEIKQMYTTLAQALPSAAVPYGFVYYMEIPGYGELYHAILPGFERPVALLSCGTELFMPVDLKAKAPATMEQIGNAEWLELQSQQYALNLNGLPYTVI